MDIVLKLAPRDYQQLRRHARTEARAREAFEKATRIEHALDGVEFEGYSISCDEDQARMILQIAKRWRPEIVRDIENAIMLSRS
jgi:hypothetical protein